MLMFWSMLVVPFSISHLPIFYICICVILLFTKGSKGIKKKEYDAWFLVSHYSQSARREYAQHVSKHSLRDRFSFAVVR